MAETNKGEKDEKMRVKLYMLNAGRVWDDQGTGYVSSTFIDKSKNMILLVKEENKNTVLLESKIQLNTAYQKQQETLIVWSEADNYDYALSFQNKAGCDEIWAQICQVQGKDPSVDITQDILLDQDDPDLDDDRFDVSGGAGHLGHHDDVVDRVSMSLPSCELGRLDDIVELFQSCLTSPIKRERLATLLESENYIGKLVELFRMSEDLEDIDALHKLFNAFKSLFFLNKTPVFEAMFADDVIFDVIGALEYDPAHQQQQQPQPIKHREYLKTQTRLKQAVPIENPELIQKIHQTYRVQYIQDAILPAPSVFEDNVLSTLTSFIYFNKMEIVTVLQEDEKYLQTLFKQLVDDDTDDDARKDMVIFLKEFCSFSQNLAQQNREGFFKALSKLGILNTVETILGLDDPTIRSYAIDIFSYIVEFSPSLVREFCMQESLKHEDDELLINIVIEQMFVDHDPEMGGALQLMGIIRLLIDPENMTTAIKNEKTEFLAFFYPHCMHVLTAPLYANTAEGKPSRDDYQTAQLLAHIVELLTFCVEHHAYHIKNHINNVNILKRVLTLLKSKHAFLQLSSLRLLRRMIGLKDDFYVRHIVKYDLLKTVVEAFKRNGHRYNLFDSAVIELFEFIRTEDIRPVIAYFVPCHFASVEDVKYVQTFQLLKQKYDQSLERVNSAPSTTAATTTAAANVSVSGSNVNFLSPLNSSMTSSTTPTSKAEQSQMDDDEETWFDQDDDDYDEDHNSKIPLNNGDLLDSDVFTPSSKFLSSKKADTTSSESESGFIRSTSQQHSLPSINHCNTKISFNLNLKEHSAFGSGGTASSPTTTTTTSTTSSSSSLLLEDHGRKTNSVGDALKKIIEESGSGSCGKKERNEDEYDCSVDGGDGDNDENIKKRSLKRSVKVGEVTTSAATTSVSGDNDSASTLKTTSPTSSSPSSVSSSSKSSPHTDSPLPKPRGFVAVKAKTPGLLGLIEYNDEDDDEEEEEEEDDAGSGNSFTNSTATTSTSSTSSTITSTATTTTKDGSDCNEMISSSSCTSNTKEVNEEGHRAKFEFTTTTTTTTTFTAITTTTTTTNNNNNNINNNNKTVELIDSAKLNDDNTSKNNSNNNNSHENYDTGDNTNNRNNVNNSNNNNNHNNKIMADDIDRDLDTSLPAAKRPRLST